MIQWRFEGDPIADGLSVYHPERNIGVILKIGNRAWRVRYSRVAKQWFVDSFTLVTLPVGDQIKRHYDL